MDRTRPRWEDRLARRGGGVELLRVPALVFGAAARLRGAAYASGLLPVARAGVPVISVGNLTSGGTGKTPMVLWLARELLRRGARPGVLARGYGREVGSARNDEGEMLARALPGLLQVQAPDRVRGAKELVAQGAEAIVLDDGFQHRRLARDVDLCLVDATRPWGLPAPAGGDPVRALLPRGLLREPPSALGRADLIAITRTECASEQELDLLESELQEIAPGRPHARARHAPVRLRDERGETSDPAALAGRSVDLVSAIGNPAAFEASAVRLGARVASHRVLPDHHAYTEDDLAGLGRDGRWLVTTAKDAVKLARLGVPFRALEIELELVTGAPVLAALLDALALPGAEARRRGEDLGWRRGSLGA